jgi:methenyltetrahydromethanopterin cyclohydrolase
MNLLNQRAARVVQQMVECAAELRIDVSQAECGARVIDCGVKAVGGIETGLKLAEVCLSSLGSISLGSSTDAAGLASPAIAVRSDNPIRACLASQYAGWQIAGKKFFAMGSGPMRAAANKEPLFADIGGGEKADEAVGVLETSSLPPDDICRQIAADCGVAPDKLTLLVARTASLAGTIQVVARSLETALHKLHALKFDLSTIVSGCGIAPLPPIGKNDLQAIGWTNDAVLYGGQVTLWVRGAEKQVSELGSQVPSSGSSAWGEPFGVLFERAGGDFYKLDPLLFSPARVTFIHLDTGRQQSFGTLRPDVLQKSFAVNEAG